MIVDDNFDVCNIVVDKSCFINTFFLDTLIIHNRKCKSVIFLVTIQNHHDFKHDLNYWHYTQDKIYNCFDIIIIENKC